MRHLSSSYEVWRKNRFVLGEEVVEILDANGSRREVLGMVGNLHHIINTAMVTSLISYSFKKMERKS